MQDDLQNRMEQPKRRRGRPPKEYREAQVITEKRVPDLIRCPYCGHDHRPIKTGQQNSQGRNILICSDLGGCGRRFML